MTVERLAPDAILASTGLSGAVTDIDDDPDAPDGAWLTAPGSNTATSVRVSFPTPTDPTTDGAGLQEFRVLVRKTNHSTNPTCSVELWRAGALASIVVASTTISSTSGVVLSGTWDATGSADADIECRVIGTPGGGQPGNRASVEVGAIEWNADETAEAPGITGSGSVGLAPMEAGRVHVREVAEAFNTPDADLESAATDLDWTVATGTTNVVSGEARCEVSLSRARAEHNLTDPDMWVEARVTTSEDAEINANGNLALRMSDGINAELDMYVFQQQFSANAVKLFRTIDGASTNLATAAGVQLDATTYYTARFEVIGSMLRGYIDDVLVIEFDDTSPPVEFTPGLKAGFALQKPVTGYSALDDWRAGTLLLGQGTVEDPSDDITGAGAAQLGPLTASGAGEVAVSGSGAAALGRLNASGSGDADVVGSGAAMLGALSADGTGAADITGSGAAGLAALDSDGAGDVSVAGAGSASIGAPSASGAGSVTVEGVGAAQLGSLAASGSGVVSEPGGITGNGSASLAPLHVDGDGSVLVNGSGVLDLSAFDVDGSGDVDVTGSGSASLGHPSAQGAGVVDITDITGSGDATLAAVGAQGAGVVDVTGSGAAQLAALVAAGSGTVGTPQPATPKSWRAYPPEERWVIETAASWGIGPAELKWEVET